MFVLCEMQTASSRIWILVVDSISYKVNHYTTNISLKKYKYSASEIEHWNKRIVKYLIIWELLLIIYHFRMFLFFQF